MIQDPIWQAFAETGDPLYYLLFRAAARQEGESCKESVTQSQTAAVNS